MKKLLFLGLVFSSVLFVSCSTDNTGRIGEAVSTDVPSEQIGDAVSTNDSSER